MKNKIVINPSVVSVIKYADGSQKNIVKKTKYSSISFIDNCIVIDGKAYKINDKGYSFGYIYKVNKAEIQTSSIDSFIKFCEDEAWRADSPYPFEYLFDIIVNKVKPLKSNI
jgi:hypothetical protein